MEVTNTVEFEHRKLVEAMTIAERVQRAEDLLAWARGFVARQNRDPFLSTRNQARFHLELATAREALDDKVMFQVLAIEQALKLDLYP